MAISRYITTALLGAACLFDGSLAHPGEVHDHEKIRREIQEYEAFATRSTASLAKCAGSESSRALKQRSIARRLETAERLRNARSIEEPLLHGRDLASLQAFEKANHDLTGSIDTNDPTQLFASNASCVLSPEVTIGPYYVYGEMVRSNITDGESGVPMHLEMQFINVNTCEPVGDLLVDIWSCNATGVYSGVASEGGLNTTFLRGVQQSSSEGVVEFDTIFPGHYQGRTTHEHIAVHTNATVLPNGSYTGGDFSHIGQLFFDEALRSLVEATSPYNTNTADVTMNDEDMIAQSQADNNWDPLVQYVLLNADDVTEGILAWIEIGIDPSANYNSAASWAAYLTEDGGHASSNSGVGGGPPGGAPGHGPGSPPNGTAGGPSGSPPDRTYGSSSSALSPPTMTNSILLSTSSSSAARRHAEGTLRWLRRVHRH